MSSSYYSLERFLVVDKHRRKIKEDVGEGVRPGEKAPITMELDVHEDLDVLLTSTTRGHFKLLEDHQHDTVRANFFAMPDDPSDVLRECVHSIYIAGAQREWGNVSYNESVDKSLFESIETYFNQYGVRMHQVFTGLKGIREMDKASLFFPPSSHEDDDYTLDRDTVESWMESGLHAGSYRSEVPIIYTEALEDYLVFTAPPDLVGQMNQIGEHANVLIHNPIFGLTVTRMYEVSNHGEDRSVHGEDRSEGSSVSEGGEADE
jgi:hypothetical protein